MNIIQAMRASTFSLIARRVLDRGELAHRDTAKLDMADRPEGGGSCLSDMSLPGSQDGEPRVPHLSKRPPLAEGLTAPAASVHMTAGGGLNLEVGKQVGGSSVAHSASEFCNEARSRDEPAEPALPTHDGKPGIVSSARKVGEKVGAQVAASLDAPLRIGWLLDAPPPWPGARVLPPEQVAADFVDWIRSNAIRRRRMITAEEVWLLAIRDFANEMNVALPKRNTFMFNLARQPGVARHYDRRVTIGSRQMKTTVYALPP